ncbi:MAG: sialate O-acetylesterase, partial [Lachnospiraceae bacterium]|nr:sialate O-acetylesterase [Lachnospiraceae bacterium]
MADRLTASRLISDHMMLQRRKPVHLWGKTEPERKVRALLAVDEDPAAKPVEAETVAQADGSWSLFLPAMEASEESRTLTITDSGDERIVVHDVLIGEVWFASGQSNMDLMLERVRDRYPVEASEAEDRCLRCFKIAEHTYYHGPLAEPLTGEWWCVSPETILAFSATGYFFAKHYRKMTGVPVGFIHASLGGSRIAGWMSREMLAAPSDLMPGGYPAYLADAEHYADDAFLAGQVKKNEQQATTWNAELERREEQNKAGLLTKDSGDGHVSGLQNEIISVPCFFRDISELRGFIGKITLTKKFTITEEMLRRAADHARIRLFLGTMVDRDEVFVNGVKVGETGYQYPPRKY